VESPRPGRGAYRGVEGNEKLTLVEGEGRLEGGGRFRVGDRVLEAPRIVLNMGARPAIPAVQGLDAVPYPTSREALELPELPAHLLVIGRGYVGVEFAQMYARLGSRVTVLQRGKRLVPEEEPQIAAELSEAFEAEGIAVHTSSPIPRSPPSG